MAGLGKTADISRVEQFAMASAPFRAHVFTAALWYGGSDRAYAERVYRRTFSLLYSSGSEVRRVSAGRALAKALHEIERPRVIAEPKPTARRPDYSEVVSVHGARPRHPDAPRRRARASRTARSPTRSTSATTTSAAASSWPATRSSAASACTPRCTPKPPRTCPSDRRAAHGSRADPRRTVSRRQIALPGSQCAALARLRSRGFAGSGTVRARSESPFGAYMPNERRSARCCGRPAASIARCAAAMS